MARRPTRRPMAMAMAASMLPITLSGGIRPGRGPGPGELSSAVVPEPSAAFLVLCGGLFWPVGTWPPGGLKMP